MKGRAIARPWDELRQRQTLPKVTVVAMKGRAIARPWGDIESVQRITNWLVHVAMKGRAIARPWDLQRRKQHETVTHICCNEGPCNCTALGALVHVRPTPRCLLQ